MSPQDKDSLFNTFFIATSLCLLCSLLVSASAVVLKPFRIQNAKLDKLNNIVRVSGFGDEEIEAAGGVEKLFEQRFVSQIIDLDTGLEAIEECEQAMSEAGKEYKNILSEYDQFWASKSKKDKDWADRNDAQAICKELGENDPAGVKYREKFSHVFMLKSEDGSQVEKYVFPVRGMGLWSLMQGYLAVEPDFKTVAGLTFYEQAETPGLGGEVMNPKWKEKWDGKKIYEDDQVALEVIKGDQSSNPYGVDALSGATITSNGVTYMLEYWMGDDGFGPFIENKKSQDSGETRITLSEMPGTGVDNG